MGHPYIYIYMHVVTMFLHWLQRPCLKDLVCVKNQIFFFTQGGKAISFFFFFFKDRFI